MDNLPTASKRTTAATIDYFLLFFCHFHLGASQNCNHWLDPLCPSQTPPVWRLQLSEPSGEARWALITSWSSTQLVKRAKVDEKYTVGTNAVALSFMAHKLSFSASALSYWSEKDKHTPLSRARLPSMMCRIHWSVVVCWNVEGKSLLWLVDN